MYTTLLSSSALLAPQEPPAELSDVEEQAIEDAEGAIESLVAEFGEVAVAQAAANVLPPPTTPKWIAGGALARFVRDADATTRAILAADLHLGKTIPCYLAFEHAVALASASAGYVRTWLELSHSDREKIRAGVMTLSSFHNHRKPVAQILDAELDKYGAEEFLAALDRATQPTAVAAE